MDRDLVERARSGDQEAFASLMHQVTDTLFGIVRNESGLAAVEVSVIMAPVGAVFRSELDAPNAYCGF